METILSKFKQCNLTELIQQVALNARNQQILLIVICAFTVHVNTLFNNFVFDDLFQILNNPWITNIKYLPNIFIHDVVHNDLGITTNYYRPMMNIIYMINYYVFAGLKAWGFHLVNIFFHIGVSVLVYLVIALLIEENKSISNVKFISIPLVSALFFAVHPIHSEAVAWLGCVPELSFSFFCMLSLFCHIRSSKNFDRGHICSLVFFCIAILCKETAVTLLPLLILYDIFYRTEKNNISYFIKRYLPFILFIAIYSMLRFNALGSLAPVKRHPELNSFEVIINIIPLFCKYLEKLLLPINLNAFHMLHPVHSIFEIKWILSLIIVFAFIFLIYLSFKKCKIAFIGLMIITIPLLPVMYIRGLGINTFSERYLYFPSIGFALIAGLLFTHGVNKVKCWSQPLNIFLVVSILVLYSIGTINRNRVWYDELSLWTDTTPKSPDSGFAHNELGVALLKKGDLESAIKEFQEGIRVDPDLLYPHKNMGIVFLNKGDMDAAIEEFQIALTIIPEDVETQNYMGLAIAQKNDPTIKKYQEAIRKNPNDAKAHNDLGVAFANNGNLNAAIQEFQEVVRLRPNDSNARTNLEIALTQIRKK